MFVLQVIKLLSAVTDPVEPNIRVAQHEDFLRLTGRHFPAMKEANEGAKNKHPTKICRVCYSQGKQTAKGLPLRTAYVCPDCPSEPGLMAVTKLTIPNFTTVKLIRTFFYLFHQVHITFYFRHFLRFHSP